MFQQVLRRCRRSASSSRGRPLDFNRYKTRHIALKFSYLGENYQGFARQKNTTETIERYLIDALVRTKLIPSIETARYNRAGRTDKGVSAFGQVVSLVVRSNVPMNAVFCDQGKTLDEFGPGDTIIPVMLPDGRKKEIREVDYCMTLNRNLPDSIVIRAWAPTPASFDARFSALYRTYRYFFAPGGLDLDRMRNGIQRLIGEHDFRYFCRMDPLVMKTFVREIYVFRIVQEETMSYFEVITYGTYSSCLSCCAH